MAAGLMTNDGIKVWTNHRGPTLIKAVARGALLGDGFTGGNVGGRQNRAPVNRHFGRSNSAFTGLFGNGDGIAGLFSRLDLIDDARQFFEADNGQSSRQYGASDLVKAQVAHVLS